MRIHNVKSWPEFFEQIKSGLRTHDLRYDTCDYKVGDFLRLQEYDPNSHFTGREVIAEITSMTSDDFPCAVSQNGLYPGYCILSIKVTDEAT